MRISLVPSRPVAPPRGRPSRSALTSGTTLAFLLALHSLAGIWAAPARAQSTGSVAGRVTDAATGEPLGSVTLLVEGTGRAALSDAGGRYLLTGLPPGVQRVSAERLGYATERREVTVTAGAVAPLDLALASDAVSVPAMVVTATREARRLDEVAASVGVVGRSAIEEIKPSHPSEVMGRVPGVWVNVTGGEGHMTAIRQPLTTDPVYLYLEDGVPTRSTGFFNHNALYEINVPQAERIEVMKGPGNALYGSDAMGGVVNVQTRAPADGMEHTLTLEGGSFGFFRALGSASGRLGAADGLRADVNYTRTDGWRRGTAYDRWSGTLRWDRVLRGVSLKTVATYSAIDQSTAGSSAISREDFENEPTLNYTPISWREVRALRLSTEVEARLGGTALTATPYVRSNRMDILPNWSLTYDPAVWETSNLSFGLLAKARRNLPSVDGLLVAGVDLDVSPGSHVERAVVPAREGKVFTSYDVGTLLYDYDVTFRQASPYLHTELAPLPRLRLTGGLRLDLLGFDYDNALGVVQTGVHRRPADASPGYSALSPKVGATLQATDRVSLFGSWRRGFRAPSEGQLFRQGSAESTVDLEPVRASSLEGGIRGTVGSRLSFDGSLYHMTKEDDILGYQLPDGRRENVNAGETLHRGVELGMGVALAPGLRLDAAFSVAEHTYEAWSPRPDMDLSGNEMASAPNTVGGAELSWAPAAPGDPRIALEWRHLGPYWMDAENTAEYEGHDLWHLRAAWTLPGGIGLFARLNNVFDARYAETAGYTVFRGQELAPGLPRTFYLGLEVR